MAEPTQFEQEAPIENEYLKQLKEGRIAKDKTRKKKDVERRKKLREAIKKTKGKMQITADAHSKFIFFPEKDKRSEAWRIRAYNIDDGNLSFLDERVFTEQGECLKELAKIQREETRGYKRVLKHAQGWGHWRLEQLACGHKILLTSSKGYIHDALTRLCVECQKDKDAYSSIAQRRAIRIVRY